jgi:hypothetical protein
MRQLKNYIQSIKDCLQSFRQGRIFLLFVLYAVLQILFVLGLMYFAYPPFAALLVPVMKKVFGDAAIHYPNNFMVLPNMYFWINLVLSGFVGIVLVGTTTDLFYRNYQKKTINMAKSFGRLSSAYAILLLIWLVETAVLLAVFFSVPALLSNLSIFAERGPMATQLATSMVAIVIGSLFIYTTALVMLEGSGPVSAIGRSFRLFARYPVATILIMAIPNFIRMPVDLIGGRTQWLILKFSPEMVAVMTILGIVVSIFSNYLLVGTVTKYYLIDRER